MGHPQQYSVLISDPGLLDIWWPPMCIFASVLGHFVSIFDWKLRFWFY